MRNLLLIFTMIAVAVLPVSLQTAVAVAGEHMQYQQQEQKDAESSASHDNGHGEKCPGMASEPVADTADAAQHDCCDNSEPCTMQCPMANCGHCLSPGQGAVLNTAVMLAHAVRENAMHGLDHYRSLAVITPTPPPNTFLL